MFCRLTARQLCAASFNQFAIAEQTVRNVVHDLLNQRRVWLRKTLSEGFHMAKKKAQKRELIDTGRDKRYVRRDSEGKFKESDDQGRSLSQDQKKKAKTKVKSGQGDKGDRG